MAMTPRVAREHIKDGVDCIGDCLESMRRVRKAFPALGKRMALTIGHLEAARGSLDGMVDEVAKAGALEVAQDRVTASGT